MQLNEYVSETLKQILEGITTAQNETSNGKVNPHIWSSLRDQATKMQILESNAGEWIHMVEFDVAVNVAEGKGTGGGVGLFVGPVVLGSKGESSSESSSTSRIKFKVPIAYPKKKMAPEKHTDVEEYRQLITNVLDQFEYIKFDKKHAWHLDIVCLYSSIVEYSDNMFVLLKKEKLVGMPLVLRSMLEAFVDLKNLCNEKTYGYHLQASNLKEWLKVSREAGKLENPYLDGLAAAKGFDDQVSEWKAELKGLKDKGYPPLRQDEKFLMADMDNEYRSLYNYLCAYSHNNIRALTDRHIEISENKDDFKVVLFPEFSAEKADHYISTAKICLTEASRLVHTALETGQHGAFNGT